MQFHGSLVDTEIGGNLLVQFALHHMGEYFQFSFAERIESCSEFTLRARDSRSLVSRARERLTASRIFSFAARFSRKSSAPPLMARTVEGMSPWPVRKRIGRGLEVCARADCRSRPFMPGICKSASTQPCASASRRARKSPADEKS